jgi:hypothetical protein
LPTQHFAKSDFLLLILVSVFQSLPPKSYIYFKGNYGSRSTITSLPTTRIHEAFGTDAIEGQFDVSIILRKKIK